MKGEHTQNVPLSVTLATSPAQFPIADGSDKIMCYGFGSCPHFFATATKRGKICIWDVSKLMKVCCPSLFISKVDENGAVHLNLHGFLTSAGAFKV